MSTSPKQDSQLSATSSATTRDLPGHAVPSTPTAEPQAFATVLHNVPVLLPFCRSLQKRLPSERVQRNPRDRVRHQVTVCRDETNHPAVKSQGHYVTKEVGLSGSLVPQHTWPAHAATALCVAEPASAWQVTTTSAAPFTGDGENKGREERGDRKEPWL